MLPHPCTPLQVYKIFPELGEAVDHLIANRHFWQASSFGVVPACMTLTCSSRWYRLPPAKTLDMGPWCECSLAQGAAQCKPPLLHDGMLVKIR